MIDRQPPKPLICDTDPVKVITPNSRQLLSLSPHDLLVCLEPYRQAQRWWVAYSGGVDSHVLLHLMAAVKQLDATVPALAAVHINHQLQAAADDWSLHCQQQADRLSVPIAVHCVSVDRQSRASLEENARQARYQCLQSLVQPGDLVLMAHHLDDQVETVFLRLLRGSGSRGMAAMPHARALGRALLYRPLLDIPRSSIERYAQQHALQWIEDPSNNCVDYDRNFLRLQLLPRLAERWPKYRQTFARAALLSEESNTLNNELAELDFHSAGLSAVSESLPLVELAQLSTARKKNLLRYWLQNRGLTLPSAAQLQAVLEHVIDAKPDADPLVQWPERDQADSSNTLTVQIRRFRGELYAMTTLPEFNASAVYQWKPEHTLVMAGVGELKAKKVLGHGLRDGYLLTIRFRQGGERCRPAGRSNSQTLKRLFQEYDVPTWLRNRIPLIYANDVLVAVGDLWVCDGFTAATDEAGLVFTWQKP